MASSTSSLFATILILSASGFLPLHARSDGGFSVELIHRDSPNSPHYDPTSTSSSRLKAAADRSRARAMYFWHAMQNPPTTSASAPAAATTNLYSDITPTNFEYLMSFYLGSSSEKIFAIADTGSDLIWTQCKPCDECYPQTAPLFDPLASPTYKVVSCAENSCSALPVGHCGSESQCEYIYVYGDGSIVEGYLSADIISFDTIEGSRVQFPHSLFGCTHRSSGLFDMNDGGLVGLGGGKLSLIRQLGSAIESRFSYCLPFQFETSAMSRLNFGSKALISDSRAVTTPLLSDDFFDTFYFLSLEQISVAGQGTVAVKPAAPAKAGWANMIIDSGTTFTYLKDETIHSIQAKIKSSVNRPQARDPNGIFSLCFNVSAAAGGNVNFPDITFHFSGGAPVILHQSNAFVMSDENTVCLALLSSNDSGINIFGNVAQQNFHISYDLAAMKLTLAPADCSNM